MAVAVALGAPMVPMAPEVAAAESSQPRSHPQSEPPANSPPDSPTDPPADSPTDSPAESSPQLPPELEPRESGATDVAAFQPMELSLNSDGGGDGRARDWHIEGPPVEPHRWYTITGFTENDGGFVKPNNLTDRYYTAGNAVSLTFHPRWADRLASRVYRNADERETAAGLFAGQLMFTPEDLKTDELIEDDRPYAGYLYGGAFWQSADARVLDHLRVELGMVGRLSLADRTQKWVHTVFGGDRPQGWDHQVPNEPTIQAFYRRKWKLTAADLGPLERVPGEVELLPDVGIAFGTVRRHLEAGATVRWGYKLPTDFGPARLDDLSGTAKTYQRGVGGYGFFRVSGRAVQHDMFIEGSNFRDGHGVEARPLVGRWEAGGRVYYRHTHWRVEGGYSQTYITRQFEGQRGHHSYASLSAALKIWF